MISSRKLFTFHCLASCGYSPLVGGPCGPSSFNPANAECVVIASVEKMSIITSCIAKSATTLQWTVNQSYYLLEQVGGFLLDITNLRKRFFIWAFFKNLIGIFISGIFETEKSHLKITVCPRHRDLFGARWRCNKTRCSILTSVGIDAHRGKSSAPKAQYGLKKAHSAYVMSATNMLVPVGSRNYLTLLLYSG